MSVNSFLFSCFRLYIYIYIKIFFVWRRGRGGWGSGAGSQGELPNSTKRGKVPHTCIQMGNVSVHILYR